MRRIEPQQPFRRGEQVIYQGKPYFWGNRSGSRRVLSLDPNGTGILVPETEVGKSIFPAPVQDEFGNSFLTHHAIRWEYPGLRTIKIKLYILQPEIGKWIGGMSASYGDLCRTIRLDLTLQKFESEADTLLHLLKIVFEDLAQYGTGDKRAAKVVLNVRKVILESLPPAVSKSFGAAR